MQELIRQRLKESAQTIEAAQACAADVERLIQLILACYRAGKKVIAFGNGGSAADAEHLVTELVGRFLKERRSLPALALTANTSLLTALGNDYGFEEVFARQIKGLVEEGDVVIGITTSGKSENVLKGLAVAKAKGAATVLLTGHGAQVTGHDVVIAVPSDSTPRIQEAHTAILHLICELVENEATGQ